MGKEIYLGDGLYASFDGFSFRLRAPRGGGDHEVYLEPSVLDDFLIYVREVKAQYEAAANVHRTVGEDGSP